MECPTKLPTCSKKLPLVAGFLQAPLSPVLGTLGPLWDRFWTHPGGTDLVRLGHWGRRAKKELSSGFSMEIEQNNFAGVLQKGNLNSKTQKVDPQNPKLGPSIDNLCFQVIWLPYQRRRTRGTSFRDKKNQERIFFSAFNYKPTRQRAKIRRPHDSTQADEYKDQ